MDFLQNASDDQIALMGCVGAFLLSGGLMVLTGYLNRSAGRIQSGQPSIRQRLPIPKRVSGIAAVSSKKSHRDAA